MSAIQTTPPAVEPVDVAQAKAHLRITHGDEDDYISTLIKTARTCIEQRTGLALLAQGWSLFLDDWPRKGVITPALRPVLDVVDIKIHGEDDATAVIDPAHYYADVTPNLAHIVLRRDRRWIKPARVVNGIELLLTLGFGTGAEDVPGPLREATLLLVGHWYARRGDDMGCEIPLAVTELLRPYQRFRL